MFFKGAWFVVFIFLGFVSHSRAQLFFEQPFDLEGFLTMDSFILNSKSGAPYFNVVAWNVGQSRVIKSLNQNLSKNLEALMGADGAPDLIVLVEAGALTSKILKDINLEVYAYEQLKPVPYSTRNPWANFIVLWKRRSLGFLTLHTEKLSYEIKDQSRSMTDDKKKVNDELLKRAPHLEFQSLVKIDFEFEKKRFSIYPVHITNIWPALSSIFYDQAKKGTPLKMAASLSAKSLTLKEILQGTQNPHAALIQNLTQRIDQLSPPDSKEENALVVGDFNAFPKLEGVVGFGARKLWGFDKSYACRVMETTFQPLYPAWGRMNSFPTHSYRSVKPETSENVLIDLAYHRGSMWRGGRAEVLPLAGSDHYPVYYRILINP